MMLRKIHCGIWICTALIPKKTRKSPCCFIHPNRLLSDKQPKDIKDSYKLLKLKQGCSVDDVRNSYWNLAKQYHPDSGARTADSATFVQIEEAYRVVLNDVTSKMKSNEEEDDEHKFKSRAPQHRQYLTFEGIGFGTPSQRERQYMQFRVDRASEQVMEYQKQKIERQLSSSDMMLAKDVRHSKKTKITQAIERLVEDLIQESMAKGDFDNLSGKGKPLTKFSDCPHIDPMTHNLNRILIDNGYQPGWILMQKEIRETIEQLRKDIISSRNKLGNSMTSEKEKQWKEICELFIKNIHTLNKRINDFNLVVPILSRQMVHFNAKKEIAHAEQISEIQIKNKDIHEKKGKKESASGGTANIKIGFIKWVNLILK